MDTYSFGKRKRELGGGAEMMASSPPNERYDSPFQPRKAPAHQYPPTHKCSDDGDDRGSEADVSCSRTVDTSGSPHNATNKVAPFVSQHDVPSSDGESGLSFISNSASPYTSDYDTGAETSSCASTAAFIDDDEEEEYDNTVRAAEDSKPMARTSPSSTEPSQLLCLGPDIMVSLVRFLEPTETLRLMTMPLCKEWRRSYTAHQDMWKTLCCEDPFSAKLNKRTLSAGCVSSVSSEDDSCFDDDSDDDSFCALGEDELTGVDSETTYDVLGEYRLLYTSFVRCMKYLKHIKEEAQNGRPPSVIEHGPDKYNRFPTFGVTKSLKKFLAKKKHISLRSVIGDGSGSFQSNPPTTTPIAPIEVLADGTQVQQTASDQTTIEIKTVPPTSDCAKPKYGKSMITERLLGPTADGTPSYLNLPTSCAIYSIVNWLVAHPDVEGIQTMCICALPTLLEDEQQRMTAQRVGIVEVILCGMLRFPKNAMLHTAAFHTMVLLARPIGGREGMLFDNSMADSTRSLGLASKARYGRIASSRDVVSSPEQQVRSSLNGVSIFIAAMERFALHEELQAMACWAMVNLALVPAQKAMLLGMNAIPAVVNAMTNHPKSYPTQFRALFALINLCVPNRNTLPTPSSGAPLIVNEQTEKDILDLWTPSIARMVIRAMENFCSSATILNRACLVLHNLSQTPDYIPVLLWTPHCYQMLEWCRANHSTDTVLLRSASSTLARIQAYLSQNQDERQKFVQSIQREKQEQR